MKGTIVFKKTWEAINAIDQNGKRKYRYIIHTGSSRSSKTFSIIQSHYLCAHEKTRRISIWRETKKDTKDTVLADMRKAVKNFELNESIIFNKTESIYTFPNNSTIEICGGDDENKVHGFQGDIAHFNEPYGISKETFDQIDMRTSEFVIIDWNPKKNHWVDDLAKQDNAIVIHSTFKDNPFCPEQQKKKILSYEPTDYNISQGTANKYMWQVYGLGLKAEKPNRIYSNWKTMSDEEFDILPYSSYYGLDFGSTNPSALSEVKFDGEKTFFIKQRLYLPISQMTTTLSEVLEGLGIDKNIPLICDSADPIKISELVMSGFNAVPANKYQGSVRAGIDFINSKEIYYTSSSKDLENEYENYEWEIVNGVNLERPIKKDDHCFVGDTLITTSKGDIEIKDINIGDYVLTSKGLNRVLIKWDNGVKKTSKYVMQFDTFSLSLHCTDNHLIKTTKGWKKISELQKSDQVYLSSILMESLSDCKKEKDISIMEQKKCMYSFGNIIMVKKSLKDFIFTISTAIQKITGLKISNLLRVKNICQNTQNQELKKILSSSKIFRKKELQKHQNGINHPKALNGIKNMQKNVISEHLITGLKSAKNVMVNIQQKQNIKDSVTTIARLKAIDVIEKTESKVYDLTVENEHEYFANGVLVHNCLDGTRYVIQFLQSYLQII